MRLTFGDLRHAVTLVVNLLGGHTRRNYFTLLLSSVFTSVLALIMLRVLQANFTDEAFSYWLLLQRLLSFLVPFLACGMGVTLAREIGRLTQGSSGEASPNSTNLKANQSASADLMKTALLALIFCTCLLVVVGYIFQESIDSYVLDTHVLAVAAPFIFSTALVAILMAAMRGFEFFLFSESSRLFFVGLGMLLAALVSEELCTFLMISALLNACICVLFLRRLPGVFSGRFSPAIALRSAQRILGDVAGPLVLIIPILYVKYTAGLEAAGMLALQILWMNVLLVLVNPLSIMILPRSRNLVSGEQNRLRFSLVGLALISGIVVAAVYFPGGFLFNAVFDITLDTEFYLLGMAVFFNVIYVITRSVVDGRYNIPFIAYILIAALVLESSLYAVGVETIAGVNSPLLPYLCASAFIALCCIWMVLRSSNESTD